MNMTFVFDTALPFADRAKTAGIVTLQGMLTIFLALALLWLTVELLHKCFSKKEKKAQEPEASAVETAPQPLSDDAAIVAAITAAIQAELESAEPGKKFRVVSFKRAQ